VVTVLPVESVELFVQRLAGGLEAGGQLRQQHARDGAVLVAGVLADEEAVRLLAAVEEFVRSGGIHLLPDPLEADVQVVVGLHAVRFADAVNHSRRDEGRDQVMILREATGFFPLLADVVGKQNGQLIAGEGFPWSLADAAG
jgi:hypothetical protein